MRVLPYLVARSVAHDLDRQGVAPGPVIRGIVGIARLAVLGMAAAFALAVLDFVGWELGIL